MISPENLGLPTIKAETILGGKTVEDSAKIFESILKGKGSKEQNAVVLANAAAALVTADQNMDFESALAKAEDALLGGKALRVFHALVNPKTSVSFSN